MIQDFLQYDFIRNAAFVGLMIGFLAPMLGVFIVVRRQALIADALSHITLAGIAASLLLSKQVTAFKMLNPVYLGMAFSVAGSILIERLRKEYKHYQELAIPIILSVGIGLSVVFISLANGFNTDLFNYLFGSIIAVGTSDVWMVLFILILVVIAVVLFYKELFLLSFDEDQAQVSGIRSRFIHSMFMVMVALVIAASMRIVGILLVSSLITLPVAASIRIARGFKQTIIIAIIFGETSVITGLVSAYYFDLAPGGTIVLLAALILVLVIIWKKFRYSFGTNSKVGEEA
ncbi:metal ABC transporter permease [Pseudalkalibacillus salsuginis]|uniref:metal ABC transporter permease n=1 Tax=Pseudalkalibacillus salsuginis TaxID=2910972 RepID=UPI001F2F97E3|nr:metal ABC transporter permease [Pseudalkalibacillus salsuginis]MCF6408501.1 metal ABC transporter permease [Pseudalkalibacillus salsuginis]